MFIAAFILRWLVVMIGLVLFAVLSKICLSGDRICLALSALMAVALKSSKFSPCSCWNVPCCSGGVVVLLFLVPFGWKCRNIVRATALSGKV